LRFEIRDGRDFIFLHGEKQVLQYDIATGRPQVAVNSEGGTKLLPVYREKLSRTWHMEESNPGTISQVKRQQLIERIKLPDVEKYRYHAADNLSSPVYGNGKIYEVRTAGNPLTETPFLRVIEMHGELVPVRLKNQANQGLHYEIYDTLAPGKAGHSLGWCEGRWTLEMSTSRHVANSVKNAVNPYMFDQQVSAAHLSPADGRGIRWDTNGQGFLKIKSGMVRIQSRNEPKEFFIRHDNKNIKLVFKDKQFHLESIGQRFYKLRHYGLGGKGALSAVHAGLRKRSAVEVIEDVFGMDAAHAHAYLGRYKFDAHQMHDELQFALELEGSGVVPAWAEQYRVVSPHTASGSRGKAKPNLERSGSLEKIGEGIQGVVFQDPASAHFVIKRLNREGFEVDPQEAFRDSGGSNCDPTPLSLARRHEMAEREAAEFCKYYGEDAASVYTQDGDVFIKMFKVPGQALSDIDPGILPRDAVQRYVDMLEKLNDVGIMHGDLNPGNVLYDSQGKMFYPIDFSNYREKFFNGDAATKMRIHEYGIEDWNDIMDIIVPRQALVGGH